MDKLDTSVETFETRVGKLSAAMGIEGFVFNKESMDEEYLWMGSL